jgi:DNA-binding NarL/FixJ family response regulator
LESTTPFKIIIADYSTGMRACLVQSLAQIPKVRIVASVPDLSSALSAVKDHGPDLIIMSSKLVGGTGLELLAAVKQHSPGVLAVFFSGNLCAELRRRCVELGADAVLEKPLGMKTLVELVKGMAEGPRR